MYMCKHEKPHFGAGWVKHLYPSPIHLDIWAWFRMRKNWVFWGVKMSKMGKEITILGKKFIMGMRYRAWCES
jgi:hypothetical protein